MPSFGTAEAPAQLSSRMHTRIVLPETFSIFCRHTAENAQECCGAVQCLHDAHLKIQVWTAIAGAQRVYAAALWCGFIFGHQATGPLQIAVYKV